MCVPPLIQGEPPVGSVIIGCESWLGANTKKRKFSPTTIRRMFSEKIETKMEEVSLYLYMTNLTPLQ